MILIRVMPAKEKRGEMKNPGRTSDAAEEHAANGKRSLKTIGADPVVATATIRNTAKLFRITTPLGEIVQSAKRHEQT